MGVSYVPWALQTHTHPHTHPSHLHLSLLRGWHCVWRTAVTDANFCRRVRDKESTSNSFSLQSLCWGHFRQSHEFNMREQSVPALSPRSPVSWLPFTSYFAIKQKTQGTLFACSTWACVWVASGCVDVSCWWNSQSLFLCCFPWGETGNSHVSGVSL